MIQHWATIYCEHQQTDTADNCIRAVKLADTKLTYSQPHNTSFPVSLRGEWPRAGSGVVRIDPLRFLAGCRTRRLNQALSSLSLSLS